MPHNANIVNMSKVFLEVASLLRLVPTPLLRAFKPTNDANIVNISKVSVEVASQLRLIPTPFLRALMPHNANIMNISKV
jgi:hypothetical protein